jgi:hypothetical protein
MSEFIPGVTSQYFDKEPIISFNQTQLEDIEKIYRGPQYLDLKMAPNTKYATHEKREKITKELAEFYEWYESGDALESHDDTESWANRVYATAIASILELVHEDGSSPLHVLSLAVHQYLGGLGKGDNRIRVISDVLSQISGVAAKIEGVENWP